MRRTRPLMFPGSGRISTRGKRFRRLSGQRRPVSGLAEGKKYIADYPNEAYLRRARELYYASISFVDYNIGKILQELKDIGEYDNTLILFTSDHGEMLGDHGTFQKMLAYDGSARIPFIARYPEKLRPGSTDRRFVDLNDLLPTFLDVAGWHIRIRISCREESIFRMDGKKDRSVQYVENGHGGRRWVSLRDRRYKYNYYYGGGREELFHMETDPDETTNLLYENPGADILAAKERLKALLIGYELRYGLEGYVEDGRFAVFEEPPISFYRENNPPMFPGKQDREYVGLEEEVKRAVREEETVKLEELDVRYFAGKGTLDEKKLFEK